jgi:Mn2+/Fe2+ NRAMP family transporter
LVTGVFGTTITPYMFFWQASGEVEEEKSHNIRSKGGRPVLTKRFLKNMRIDNAIGMTFAQISQWFIVITAATVLFSAGINNIDSAADAAKALEPLVQSFPNAGLIAKVIFAVGVIGIGLQAIPVLAGSSAYALSEAMGWKSGLSRKFKKARGFYFVIIISMLIGLGMNFIGINPIKALIFTAVFNGVSAVPLLYVIAKINGNANILGDYKGSMISRLIIWIAFGVMALAAIGLFYAIATS